MEPAFEVLKEFRDSELFLRSHANDEFIFFDNLTGHEFKSEPINVFWAVEQLNKLMHCNNDVTVLDWVELLGLTSFNEYNDRNCGWGLDCISNWGHDMWINVRYLAARWNDTKKHSELRFVIFFDTEPCAGFQNGHCECYG